MIELPRAALRAGEIAEHAEFFSFGTNDLTQMTLGLSRDDSGKFLEPYIRAGIFHGDPFQTLDIDGVGELVEIASERGRTARPDLKLGICGEHGGDPASVAFCETGRARLRLLLALPGADRAPGGGAGGAAGQAGALSDDRLAELRQRRQGGDGEGAGARSRRRRATPRPWPCWMPPGPSRARHVIGLTGPPGVGKSTLVSAWCAPGARRPARSA